MGNEGDIFPYNVVLYKPGGDFPQSRCMPRELCTAMVRNIINEIVPIGYLKEEGEGSFEKRFHDVLPLVTWSKFNTVPFELSFYLLCELRFAVSKFFYEMIHWWLVPGKFLNISSFFAADFYVEGFHKKDIYTVCELSVWVETEEDFRTLCRNLPSIEAEVRLGTMSVYHANRILEVKGLTIDVKTAMIQEHIVSLMNRRPQDFDYNIFTEMHYFLVTCKENFKLIRDYRHMGRIIIILYLFRTWLSKLVEEGPDRKRHVMAKFFRVNIHDDDGSRPVLAVMVGINFLGGNEVFEERHLLKAIRNFVPDVSAVQGSFFATTGKTDNICTTYLEVEKSEGKSFSLKEIGLLRKELALEIKGCVEHFMHPVFMPRNEEEVMRNILTLGGQLKYVRDLPQVIISFDKQTDFKISFTVILVRLLKNNPLSIEEMFLKADTTLDFFPEQVRGVGYLRKKYAKEANVFRVEVDKINYLREDHSLDLYKARRAVVFELANIVGEFRDYNGGLITKQNEVFCDLRDMLGDVGRHNVFLLENFFYSLSPSVMRNILEPAVLKHFFSSLLDGLEDVTNQERGYSFVVQDEGRYVYVMLVTDDSKFTSDVKNVINELKIDVMDLAMVFLVVHDMPCLGYIYRCDDSDKKELFIESIKQVTPCLCPKEE